MPTEESAPLKNALLTAREMLSTLGEIETAYASERSPIMSWIQSDAQLVQAWIDLLQDSPTREDIERVWGDVRSISRTLGTILNDPASDKYRELQGRLYRYMSNAIADARRGC